MWIQRIHFVELCILDPVSKINGTINLVLINRGYAATTCFQREFVEKLVGSTLVKGKESQDDEVDDEEDETDQNSIK